MKLIDVQNAYEFLRECKPFSKWNLPLSIDVDFKLNRSNMAYGTYEPDPHCIVVSTILCDNYTLLLKTMAHEMVHLALERGGDTLHADHIGKFNRYAQKVCDEFGWEWEKF